MGLFNWLFGAGQNQSPAPSAALQSSSGGVTITTSSEMEEALRNGSVSSSGVSVTPNTAMTVPAVYACVRIIAGAVATMPLGVYKRLDHRTREPASDSEIYKVIARRPNRWQTPSQFRRMLQAHVLLRGNGFALIVRSRGIVKELLPLRADRVEIVQRDDLRLEYIWTRKNGQKVTFQQDEIFHLVNLTFDGFTGVTPITYARETIGLSLAQERHGATNFKNGLNVGGYLKSDKILGEEGRQTLRDSMDEYRSEGERSGKWMVLEDGLEAHPLTMTQADAQWIESRKFTRTDITMFYGVPPHMIGDTEKSTSWGSGIEHQSIGFVSYALEDHLTMWEEAGNRDLLTDKEIDLYFRFNRSALVRGDIKSRWESHVKALQWGVKSPNEIRALEDENPRDDGDIYYDPPNVAGDPDPDQKGAEK